MARVAVVALLISAALYGLHRLALWAERRGFIYYLRRRASSSTLGNAFLEVQSLLEPGKGRVVEERTRVELEEADAEGGDGEPATPAGRRPRTATAASAGRAWSRRRGRG